MEGRLLARCVNSLRCGNADAIGGTASSPDERSEIREYHPGARMRLG
jgi:hypothetical protein